MLFSSLSFLFYFLPAIILLYFIVPKKLKNAVLLVFSLFFYAWGGIKYAALMVIAIMMGYVAGLLIEKYRGRKLAKWVLFFAVAAIISFMLYFKYTNFFIDNFNKITGASVAFLKLTLPIGISFYTFQIISYVVDVYRGEERFVRLEVNDSAVGLIQKGNDSEREGISVLQDRNDLLERSARIDDILNDDNMIVADILREVHGDLYVTAGRRAGIALCAHEGDLARYGDRAAKICHEDKRAVENADEKDRSAVIGTVDLFACLLDRSIDFFLGNDDILDLAVECFDGLEFFHDDFSLMNKMIYFT